LKDIYNNFYACDYVIALPFKFRYWEN